MKKLAFIFFVLCLVYVNASGQEKTNDDSAEGIFKKVLDTIANTNEQRFAIMKKLTVLQDRPIELDALRNGDQNSSSEEINPIVAYIVTDNASGEEKTYGDYAQGVFSKLLDTIAKTNEQRLAIMKKLTVWQDRPIDLDALRNGDQNSSSEEINPIVAYIVTDNASGEEQTSDDSAEGIFNKLLYSIANTNEQRFTIMKNLTSLEDQPVELDALMAGDQNSSSEEINSIVTYIVTDDTDHSTESVETPTTPSYFSVKSYSEGSLEKNSHSEGSSEKLPIDMEAIRRTALKACDKGKAKVCQKACTEAYKQTCARVFCQLRMKGIFIRHCRTVCRSRFTFI